MGGFVIFEKDPEMNIYSCEDFIKESVLMAVEVEFF